MNYKMPSIDIENSSKSFITEEIQDYIWESLKKLEIPEITKTGWNPMQEARPCLWQLVHVAFKDGLEAIAYIDVIDGDAFWFSFNNKKFPYKSVAFWKLVVPDYNVCVELGVRLRGQNEIHNGRPSEESID